MHTDTVKKQILLVIASLMAVTFFAHFFYMSGFGLYEDDYTLINVNWSGAQVWYSIKDAFASWSYGRPFGYLMMYGFTYIGSKFGGLAGIYLIGYMIVVLNSVLVYCVLRKITPVLFAFLGAMVFCLFPADTTKEFLTHDFGVQTGITFMLLASLAYLNGKRIMAYALICVSFLIYESMMLAFILVPLLNHKLDKQAMLVWLKHVVIIAFLIGILMVVRMIMGDSRLESEVVDADKLYLVFKAISSMAAGPLISLSTFLARPVTAVLEANAAAWLIAAASLPGLYILLKHISAYHDKASSHTARENIARVNGDLLSVHIEGRKDITIAVRLMIVGSAMWCLSYALAFTDVHWPPLKLAGRLSSVHIAGTFPAAVFVSGLLWLVYEIGKSNKKVFLTMTAVYFSVLVAWGVVIQNDYTRSWEQQRRFWQDLIKLAPDFTKRNFIIVMLQDDIPKTRYIHTHSWADGMVLGKLLNLSDDLIGKEYPVVYIIDRSQFGNFVNAKGRLAYRGETYISSYIKMLIDPEKTVMLNYKSGKLARIKDEVVINRMRIRLPDAGDTVDLEKTPLLRLLMNE